MKRIISLIVVVLILISAVPFCYAEGTPVLSYVFSGESADKAGYAEGQVTLSEGRTSGYYYLYWADDAGVLSDYEHIASLTATKSPVTYAFAEGVAIPMEATRLLAFWSASATPTSAASALVAAYTLPTYKRFAETPEFSFASVSDIHINYTSQGAAPKLISALNYFDDLGLEYVFVSGDISDVGSAKEYQEYIATINDSRFPADRIYESRGNHEATDISGFLTYTSSPNEVRPYPNSPYYYVLLSGGTGEKDNLFICMAQEISSSSSSASQDNFSTAQLDWLENLLKTYSGTNTNIFIVQHSFVRNWGPGDRPNGAYSNAIILSPQFPNNLRYKALLETYKECIVMSGHSHVALREGYNFSTVSGTAARMIHNSSLSQPRVYRADGTLDYKDATVEKGSEGYAVYVYADDITYIGTDLTTKKKIPSACFIFPSYTEDRVSATAIRVSKAPDTTDYMSGEKFDPRGMEIVATFGDRERVVKGWYCDTETPLSANNKQVTIRYGDLSVNLPITIDQAFEGLGTKANPFLIQNASDFKKLTKLFESKIISDSNDNQNSYAYGKYFLQTADIDMTGVSAYVGTDASGYSKKSFGGIYDGGGHTLRVAITSGEKDVSVFPYVGGVVMNLTFQGSITAGSNAQIVRTLGSKGSIINCHADITLSGGATANGLCYSMYGSVYRFYNTSTLLAPTQNLSAISNSSTAYTDFYHNISNGAGGTVGGAYGTHTDNITALTSAMNNFQNASALEEKLKSYNLALEDLCLWKEGRLTTITYAEYSRHNYQSAFDEQNHYKICIDCDEITDVTPHVFTDDCGSICECGFFKEVANHIYSDACDITCNVCGAIRVTKHNFGNYVYNNDATTKKDGTKTRTCSVCGHKETVTAAGTKLPTTQPQQRNPFTDVKKSDFYYSAVLWAVEKDITAGTTKTTFAPKAPCTRGQIVTFLWRAAGCPTPKSSKNPFTDVKKSDFYYNAVLWAVGKNITSGTSNSTFSPSAPCTRGQIAAFLWRAAGTPQVKTSKLPFKDVKKSDYYFKAVLWAVEKEITSGTTKTTFAPSAPCTRGQIVTFLHRYY